MPHTTSPTQTVSITDLRRNTRAIVRAAASSDEPIYVLVHSTMPVCLMSVKQLGASKKKKGALGAFTGFLRHSKAFSEGPLRYQRKIRKEWA